jgi:hypothetical protein
MAAPHGSLRWTAIFLNLQRLQYTTGNLPRRASARDLHVTLNIPYVYDFVTKLSGQQSEVMQNHKNAA